MGEVDSELPLAVARAQAASILELDSELALVHQGRLLGVEEDEHTPGVCGLQDGSILVAVAKRPRRDAGSGVDAMPLRSGSGASTGATCSGVGPSGSSPKEAPGDDELARQLQADEDELTARRVQEEVDGTLAREEQVRQAMGDARAAEVAAVPQLVFVRGDIAACGSWIPLVVDTGAQTSILTSGLAERLGLLRHLDHNGRRCRWHWAGKSARQVAWHSGEVWRVGARG